MIYELVRGDADIRQGDIFRSIPRVDISLASLPVMEKDGELNETSWQDFIDEPEGDRALSVILPVRPVDAIVITQDCDCARGEYVSLCQIERYVEVAGLSASPPKDDEAWRRKIVKGMSEQPRLFYLPIDPRMGIPERMAVDFRVVLPVRRTDLESLRRSRIGRLNSVAYEHFRESLAQFFRRYPVNVWYPLSVAEFGKYSESIKPPEKKPSPYPWQVSREGAEGV